jgi:2,4-dienoyl-CoA reductase-like NADH-dependent reductase (Old Yellow Enzyme family)
MQTTDPILQPFTIKNVEFRNRMISTAHAPGYIEDRMPKDRYRLYHLEKARGGIGLTMFGGSCTVSIDSPSAFGQIDLSTDKALPWIRALANSVHDEGARIMCQITHLGRRTAYDVEHWLPPVAPSSVRERPHGTMPAQISIRDIDRIVTDYGDAALRCAEAGLDGVELMAYGHLIDQFWTPAFNQRSDEFGGELEGRLEFVLRVLEEINGRLGDRDDFLIGIRMTADDQLSTHLGIEGLDQEECLRIARRLELTGHLDFINIVGGHLTTDMGLADCIPPMGNPSAPFLNLAGEMKNNLKLPVMHATRITDVATARYALSSGLVDFIGMTRGHMADPHIVNKIKMGQEDRIRPCVGAGYCLDRLHAKGEALCLHNPATGREGGLPHQISRSCDPAKRVLVVGAGPAGLEAARVCGSRGHQVRVLEAGNEVGGQLLLASKVERRKELISIVGWLKGECDALGVEFVYQCFAEVMDVVQFEPDMVIIATGGLPLSLELSKGSELITGLWDVLSGFVPPAKNVLLYDDNGGHQAMSSGEYLFNNGTESLEVVSPHRVIGREVGDVNFPHYLRGLYQYDVRLTPDWELKAIERASDGLEVVLWNEYSATKIKRRVDQVIVENGTMVNDELYHNLIQGSSNLGEVDFEGLKNNRPTMLNLNDAGKYYLYRIGDAWAQRNVHAAIYDALRLLKDY